MQAGISFLFCLLFASVSWGRVFNINNETFAPYFVIGGSSSSISAKPFEGETSTSLNYSQGFTALYSGEFGFLYSHSLFNLRLGLEVLKPPSAEVTARQNNVDLYTVSSQILGFIPKLGFELNLRGDAISRSFISFAYGIPSVTFKNDYVLTSDGQTAFGGIGNHSTEVKGSGSSLAAALGYEGFLSDSTTLLVEFGYRRMKIDNWSYAKDADTFSGSYQAGDSWVRSTGERREIDFSGAYITLGFRVYL